MFPLRSIFTHMQYAFDFEADTKIRPGRRPAEMDRMLARLREIVRLPPGSWNKLEPVAQLAQSLVSSRAYERDSEKAFYSLVERYPNWAEIAEADPREIETTIAATAFPQAKAKQLKSSMAQIRREHPDFDLDFLRFPPVPAALGWLEQLEGVGRKIAASVLNLSTLNRPAFVVDANVLRVLIRLGHVGRNANAYDAYDFVMSATPGWKAEDYAELHVLLKLLGQRICEEERPRCQRCPLSRTCPRMDV